MVLNFVIYALKINIVDLPKFCELLVPSTLTYSSIQAMQEIFMNKIFKNNLQKSQNFQTMEIWSYIVHVLIHWIFVMVHTLTLK